MGKAIKRFREWMLDYMRMGVWLTAGIVLYVLSFDQANPAAQFVLGKTGSATIGAWIGYMADRHAFPQHRIERDDCPIDPRLCSNVPIDRIRRAIVIAAAMLAMAIGT
jgi:hypothetical protein